MTGTIPVLNIANLILVLDIMRHSIGNCHIPNKKRKAYRNYYSVESGSTAYDKCEYAKSWGLMDSIARQTINLDPNDKYYFVTDLGLRVLGMTTEAITKFHKELEQ